MQCAATQDLTPTPPGFCGDDAGERTSPAQTRKGQAGRASLKRKAMTSRMLGLARGLHDDRRRRDDLYADGRSRTARAAGTVGVSLPARLTSG